jgi:hypothetical protein
VSLTVAVLATSPAGAQPAKSTPAKVTISGKEVGTLTVSDGAKTERFVLLEVDAKTTIKVVTDQDVAKFNKQMLAKATELFEEFKVKARKLAENGDKEGLLKAQKEFEAASAEVQSYFNYYVAEGSLTVVDGELRLTGELRPFAYQGADKALGKGKAVVEGEATKVKFDGGQGAKLTLAIRNGNGSIVVTGKAADEMANAKGTLRAQGVIRFSKTGPVLDAESVQTVKK